MNEFPKNPFDNPEPSGLRGTLYGMKVGDITNFPLEKMKSVRATASELGAMRNRKYQTKMDKPNQLIWVKRVS